MKDMFDDLSLEESLEWIPTYLNIDIIKPSLLNRLKALSRGNAMIELDIWFL